MPHVVKRGSERLCQWGRPARRPDDADGRLQRAAGLGMASRPLVGQRHRQRHAGLLANATRDVAFARQIFRHQHIPSIEHALAAIADFHFHLPGHHHDILTARSIMKIHR